MHVHVHVRRQKLFVSSTRMYIFSFICLSEVIFELLWFWALILKGFCKLDDTTRKDFWPLLLHRYKCRRLRTCALC